MLEFIGWFLVFMVLIVLGCGVLGGLIALVTTPMPHKRKRAA